MRSPVALAALLVAACTQPPPAADASMPSIATDAAPDAAPDGAPDASPKDAPAAGDPRRCATPDACTWIEDYQREVVGRLAGERPIAEGV